jgi:hypothetical protein
MQTMVDEFLNKVKNSRYFTENMDYETIPLVNFSDEGEQQKSIFDINLSGIELRLSAEIRKDLSCSDYIAPTPPPPSCEDAELIINETTEISIGSGDTFELNVTLNGTPSGTYNEATETWEVVSEPCPPSEITFTFDNNLIAVVDTSPYNIDCSTEFNGVFIENCYEPLVDGFFALVGQQNGKPRYESDNYVILYIGIRWIVEAIDGSGFGFEALLGNEATPDLANWDGQADVIVQTISDYCGGGVCADATVTVNGNAFDTVVSGGTLDVPVEYVNGTPVGSIVSGVVQVPNPIAQSGIAYQRPQLTFQATSYRTGDAAWVDANYPYSAAPTNPLYIAELVNAYTLANNNVFGNTYRFTDQSGNVAILNNVSAPSTANSIIDHYTGLEWAYLNSQTGNNKNWDTAIDEALALNVQGFDDWYLPTMNDWLSLVQINGNHAGLNNCIFGGSRIFWTSNTDFLTTTSAVIFNSITSFAATLNVNAKSVATRNWMAVRRRY